MALIQRNPIVTVLFLLPCSLAAQGRDQAIPVTNWPAPLYWQEPVAQGSLRAAEGQFMASTGHRPLAGSSTAPLVFVGMTPCRLMDTRTGYGQTGAFGPPSIPDGGTRTLPIPTHACGVPANASAYSLNVTVVPNGVVWFLVIWPTGQARPNASTMNDPGGVIMANAAVVPAGTNGSVDIFVTNTTDVLVDINGYYAPQSSVTLAQGAVATPSLTFSGDTGTGIYSAGAGSLDFSTGGTNRMTLRSDGDLNLMGNIRKAGGLFLHNLGTDNTALGLGALVGNTTGTDNTATGYNALALTTGLGNTAVGSTALEANTTGYTNTAVGFGALVSNATGNDNAAFGSVALHDNVAGSNNVALGFQSGQFTTGNWNVMIANRGYAGESGVIRIGEAGNQTTAYISGIKGVTTSLGGAVPVLIDNNGQLGTTSSSARFKEDVHDMEDASAGLLRLRPVTFRYKQPYADGSKPTDYGLIAEEVAQVYPDLVVRGRDGQIETVQYQKLTPMLLNEVQKQNRTIEAQSDLIRQLESRLSALEAGQK